MATIHDNITALQEQAQACIIIVLNEGEILTEIENYQMLIGIMAGKGKIDPKEAFNVQEIIASLIDEPKPRKPRGPNKDKKDDGEKNKEDPPTYPSKLQTHS